MESFHENRKSKTAENDNIEKLQTAPEGWLTMTQVCKTFWPNRKFLTQHFVTTFDSNSGEYKEMSRGNRNDIPYHEIKVFVSRYKETNPEYFNIYKTRGGNAEHFSPELVKIIADHFKKPIPT